MNMMVHIFEDFARYYIFKINLLMHIIKLLSKHDLSEVQQLDITDNLTNNPKQAVIYLFLI